jgi:23S rRNA pseudouridine1911/1915/1917 synthase
MEIPILYEDNDVLVLNKPAGISVHKDGFNDQEFTIADWVVEKYPALIQVGEPLILKNGTKINKPGIVHRLDKDTTGVLLIAKNQATYNLLKKQFQDHSIEKTYWLLVYGNFSPDKEQGTIDLPIGRSRKDPRRRLAGLGASSVLREALTHYKVTTSFPGYSLVEAHPKTGRTHQLRVHFKAIGHPLVCDSLYAPGLPCLPGLARQALHAAKLEFDLPSGGRKTVDAPLPEDLKIALDNLKTMC